MVLLWEFAKVSECKDALTTTTKLVLPPRALASSSKTTEEVFEYSEPALNSIGGTPTDTTSPNMDLNNQNLSGAATSIPGIRDTIHSASMPDINELPSSAKPQVRLQKTFQSMQHLQPHQMWQQQQQPLQGIYQLSSFTTAQYFIIITLCSIWHATTTTNNRHFCSTYFTNICVSTRIIANTLQLIWIL